MGQIVSGYLDFAERQAEREQVMTMVDWAKHLDNIWTMSGIETLRGPKIYMNMFYSADLSATDSP